MTYLFSYGTLQDIYIQKELFNRQLTGSPDILPGFELCLKKAYGQYPVISKAASLSAQVTGMVYEILPDELGQVDTYEGEAYTRTLAQLKSGKKAWVYIAK